VATAGVVRELPFVLRSRNLRVRFAPAPVPLLETTSGVYAHRDSRDCIWGLAVVSDSFVRFDWPGIAAFWIDPGSDLAVAAPFEESYDEQTILDFFYRVAFPRLLHGLGVECLHASAAELQAGALLLTGDSTAGKSSLAAQLALEGYRSLGDDAAPWRQDSTTFLFEPLPFRLRPRSSSGENRSDSRSESWGMIESRDGSPLPIAAVVELNRRTSAEPARPPRIERLSGAEALQALLDQSTVHDRNDAGRIRVSIDRALALLESVPIFRCSFDSDLARISEVTKALVRTASRAS
jgi:hypothetical protein